ncbi:hypothetical protein Mp_8g10110 [Marchantia polymorpha subsp. ruderalis]|uniref:Uncharacterized protein n=1 Tax=Marchantia polymorpha TaxID=3197 RepID=A0A2R6XMY9_MARPO|nr:hypothetical protein MARPO_0008s0211 [Marchantia polymorpha]BBN19372.1 hypothetical protein Mp_8g10110 [Marchantia polymorpha subsp. ruderalis]|eukprot:PTQ47461.1 hypothetical protein MARPO_0008s0211 [Marchantia polymorpha]
MSQWEQQWLPAGYDRAPYLSLKGSNKRLRKTQGNFGLQTQSSPEPGQPRATRLRLRLPGLPVGRDSQRRHASQAVSRSVGQPASRSTKRQLGNRGRVDCTRSKPNFETERRNRNTPRGELPSPLATAVDLRSASPPFCLSVQIGRWRTRDEVEPEGAVWPWGRPRGERWTQIVTCSTSWNSRAAAAARIEVGSDRGG